MFFYQPIFNVLDSKMEKGIGWKSKAWYNSKLIALHGAFLPNVKYFGVKIETQFNNTSLDIE